MKVCIVGAGWYGCHLALSLLQKGAQVDVFERADRSISGASRYNQNRLHQGFHYPRDYETRRQSLEGFSWFIQHYGNLVSNVENNIYGVADTLSNIDSETFKQIMEASQLEFEPLQDKELINKFQKISGLMLTNEKLILNHQASRFFDDILKGHINYNTYIDLADAEVISELENKYDYIIDCTWGTTRKIPELEYYYEPCIYFYYRKKIKENFAMTLMDGQFFSIFPYDGDRYTVTSVKNTPITQVSTREEIGPQFKLAKAEAYVSEKRELFEREIETYYPKFLEDFEYIEPVYSLKTKLVSGTDYRGCIVVQEDKLISVFSGKIDTLHIAEENVMRMIFND